jgi:predicted nucleic acid-binding protein
MMLVLDASMALAWIFARPLRLSAPLATFDRKLAGAAQAAGGAVFA